MRTFEIGGWDFAVTENAVTVLDEAGTGYAVGVECERGCVPFSHRFVRRGETIERALRRLMTEGRIVYDGGFHGAPGRWIGMGRPTRHGLTKR